MGKHGRAGKKKKDLRGYGSGARGGVWTELSDAMSENLGATEEDTAFSETGLSPGYACM
jgi:hypothetical protein